MTMSHAEYLPDIAQIRAWAELPAELRDKVAQILLSIGALRKVGPGDTWIREGEQTENKG